LGIIPIIWLAVLIAPYTNEGIIVIIEQFSSIMSKPFNFIWCENSLRTILIFLAIYIFGISIYVATRKNYRRREEHGSAQWGNAKSINKKYKQEPFENNKILTQNVSIGLNGRKHRRNLNVLVCGR
jgi:type IV secretion system protein VirD4